MLDVCGLSILLVTHSTRYFAPLAFGVADAAGEGLGTGVALVAGAFSVGVLGEDDVAGVGLATVGVELTAGSEAQPAASKSEESVRTKSAVRLIAFMFRVVIVFVPRFSKI
ncbi:MAG: hypothetical protein H7Z16_18540 [Pyrinomonadaceae bacterium]|nr:hypothetical protein [Pyrinomonadaceae bacterium]